MKTYSLNYFWQNEDNMNYSIARYRGASVNGDWNIRVLNILSPHILLEPLHLSHGTEGCLRDLLGVEDGDVQHALLACVQPYAHPFQLQEQ